MGKILNWLTTGDTAGVRDTNVKAVRNALADATAASRAVVDSDNATIERANRAHATADRAISNATAAEYAAARRTR